MGIVAILKLLLTIREIFMGPLYNFFHLVSIYFQVKLVIVRFPKWLIWHPFLILVTTSPLEQNMITIWDRHQINQ